MASTSSTTTTTITFTAMVFQAGESSVWAARKV
jgi:hypothetical protein